MGRPPTGRPLDTSPQISPSHSSSSSLELEPDSSTAEEVSAVSRESEETTISALRALARAAASRRGRVLGELACLSESLSRLDALINGSRVVELVEVVVIPTPSSSEMLGEYAKRALSSEKARFDIVSPRESSSSWGSISTIARGEGEDRVSVSGESLSSECDLVTVGVGIGEDVLVEVDDLVTPERRERTARLCGG